MAAYLNGHRRSFEFIWITLFSIVINGTNLTYYTQEIA